MSSLDQVSVPLPKELRAYVARVAEQEDRSQASVIRRLVADAARKRKRLDPVRAQRKERAA